MTIYYDYTAPNFDYWTGLTQTVTVAEYPAAVAELRETAFIVGTQLSDDETSITIYYQENAS